MRPANKRISVILSISAVASVRRRQMSIITKGKELMDTHDTREYYKIIISKKIGLSAELRDYLSVLFDLSKCPEAIGASVVSRPDIANENRRGRCNGRVGSNGGRAGEYEGKRDPENHASRAARIFAASLSPRNRAAHRAVRRDHKKTTSRRLSEARRGRGRGDCVRENKSRALSIVRHGAADRRWDRGADGAGGARAG